MAVAQLRTRKACEKIIGHNLMAYILHLRPMEWPIMTIHFLLGSILSCGLNVDLKRTISGWIIFIVLLNGGTLAINSVFDEDSGDIGYLRKPPKPPKYLLHVSTVMLATALLAGFFLPNLFAWCNAICVAMSILYSVPPFRLKACAGWDLFINCIGFGLLTPLAGWGLTGRHITIGIISISVGFTFLFAALYPLTQLYQIKEDRNRGDRTLTIVLGEPTSLLLAILMAILAHLLFAWGAAYYNKNISTIAISLLFWLASLFPWLANWRQKTPKQKESGMYIALTAWAITDISILVLFWPTNKC